MEPAKLTRDELHEVMAGAADLQRQGILEPTTANPEFALTDEQFQRCAGVVAGLQKAGVIEPPPADDAPGGSQPRGGSP